MVYSDPQHNFPVYSSYEAVQSAKTFIKKDKHMINGQQYDIAWIRGDKIQTIPRYLKLFSAICASILSLGRATKHSARIERWLLEGKEGYTRTFVVVSKPQKNTLSQKTDSLSQQHLVASRAKATKASTVSKPADISQVSETWKSTPSVSNNLTTQEDLKLSSVNDSTTSDEILKKKLEEIDRKFEEDRQKREEEFARQAEGQKQKEIQKDLREAEFQAKRELKNAEEKKIEDEFIKSEAEEIQKETEELDKLLDQIKIKYEEQKKQLEKDAEAKIQANNQSLDSYNTGLNTGNVMEEPFIPDPNDSPEISAAKKDSADNINKLKRQQAAEMFALEKTHAERRVQTENRLIQEKLRRDQAQLLRSKKDEEEKARQEAKDARSSKNEAAQWEKLRKLKELQQQHEKDAMQYLEDSMAGEYFDNWLKEFLNKFFSQESPSVHSAQDISFPKLTLPEGALKVHYEILEKAQAEGDYKRVFELSDDYTQQELDSKFRKLCLKVHPDRNPNLITESNQLVQFLISVKAYLSHLL